MEPFIIIVVKLYAILAAIYAFIFWIAPKLIATIKHPYERRKAQKVVEYEELKTRLGISQGMNHKKKMDEGEPERKAHLAKFDSQVDPILAKIYCALQSLESQLPGFESWDLNDLQVYELQKWRSVNDTVMDFELFEHFWNYCVNIGDKVRFVDIDQANELLYGEPIAKGALDYADMKLGIRREYIYCDGVSSSWIEYETKSGNFEDIETRWRNAKQIFSRGEKGYVYILGNDSLDGIYKVGKTRRDPKERAEELSKHTGVPTPYYVVHERVVDSCDTVELELHKRLSRNRVSDNREFFKTSPEEILRVLNEITNTSP